LKKTHVVVASGYQKLIGFNGRGTFNKYASIYIYALKNFVAILIQEKSPFLLMKFFQKQNAKQTRWSQRERKNLLYNNYFE